MAVRREDGTRPIVVVLPTDSVSRLLRDLVAIGGAGNVVVLMDWSRYVVADRIGTTVVVGNMIGTNGRSIASHEVFAYRRYGADAVDVNAGRVLKL
jgi:predicted phage gp36 major capsid-like protein